MLAQSVELASKSYLFNSGTISKSDFTEVGHLPTKGFEKSIDKIETGFSTIKENLDQIQLSETEIPEFDINSVHSHRIRAKTAMSAISKKPKQFKNMSKKKMQNILLAIENFQKQLEKSQNKKISDPDYLKNSRDFRKDIIRILDSQKKLPKDLNEMFKFHATIFNEMLGDTLDIKDKAIVYHNLINVTITLSLLSFVTQSHAIDSRYNIYDETHLLIKNFPQIKTQMTKALVDLENFYIISEKSQKSEIS